MLEISMAGSLAPDQSLMWKQPSHFNRCYRFMDLILAELGIMPAVTCLSFRIVLIVTIKDGQCLLWPDLAQRPDCGVRPVIGRIVFIQHEWYQCIFRRPRILLLRQNDILPDIMVNPDVDCQESSGDYHHAHGSDPDQYPFHKDEFINMPAGITDANIFYDGHISFFPMLTTPRHAGGAHQRWAYAPCGFSKFLLSKWAQENQKNQTLELPPCPTWRMMQCWQQLTDYFEFIHE